MLWALLLLATALAICAVYTSLRYGGWPERSGGLIILVMLVAPRLAHFVYPKVFIDIDPAAFATDLLALIGFVAIALKAQRYWPLWVSAFQLLSVTAHLIRWFDVAVEPLVYAAMSGGPSYMISLTICGASIGVRRKQLSQAGLRR